MKTILIFTVAGLMWINYPQTAYSFGVASATFQSNELFNTNEMKDQNCTDCMKHRMCNYSLKKDCAYYKLLTVRRYQKTEKGVFSAIYVEQCRRSRNSNWPQPGYSKTELIEWMYENGFKKLYNAWVKSDYDKWLKPSVDRIIDYGYYTFDNIQLGTWDDNRNNNNYAIKNGLNRKHTKRTTAVKASTGEVFVYYSIAEAARTLGVSRGNIDHVLRGNRHTAGGYYWYVEERGENKFLE